MKKIKLAVVYFLSALTICLMVACGGSGGSDNPEPPATGGNTAPDNNWDSLVWDQGEWQ